MLWIYALKEFSEQLNSLKVDDDGVTPMQKFAGTETYITLKNHHTWGCPVYVLDAGQKGKIYGFPKWEP